MCRYRLIGWRATFAAVAVIWLAGWNIAQAQPPPNGDAAVSEQSGGYVDFAPVSEGDLVQSGGWLSFESGKMKIEAAAPVSVFPLHDVERKEWLWDLATFQLDKIEDRQVMYTYYLQSSDEGNEMANAVLDAVEKAADATDLPLWMAVGVEYSINDGSSVQTDESIFRHSAVVPSKWSAVVPSRWSKDFQEFIKGEHGPDTFAALIQATTKKSPKKAYANFEAVGQWSALANNLNLESTMAGAPKDPKGRSPAETSYLKYLKAVSEGRPVAWDGLTAVASFIALNRKLDVEGIEPNPVLTSKMAWPTMMGN